MNELRSKRSVEGFSKTKEQKQGREQRAQGHGLCILHKHVAGSISFIPD